MSRTSEYRSISDFCMRGHREQWLVTIYINTKQTLVTAFQTLNPNNLSVFLFSAEYSCLMISSIVRQSPRLRGKTLKLQVNVYCVYVCNPTFTFLWWIPLSSFWSTTFLNSLFSFSSLSSMRWYFSWVMKRKTQSTTSFSHTLCLKKKKYLPKPASHIGARGGNVSFTAILSRKEQHSKLSM